jgi:hypothetical protein
MKQSIRKKKNVFLLALYVVALMGVVACGSDDDDDDNTPETTTPQQETIEGVYNAPLAPVNPLMTPTITGNFGLNLTGDNLAVQTQLVNGPIGNHVQAIYTGTTCPTIANDTNSDGYVDVVEAQAVAGKILIPLDSDINTQDAGAGKYPNGNLNYNKAGSFNSMVNDLLLPDPNPNDSIVKIADESELVFEGKVVIVHGVPLTTILPSTVQGIDGLSSNATLPISCGVIGKSTEDTGGGTTTGGTSSI